MPRPTAVGFIALASAFAVSTASCGDPAPAAWSGTIDTLASGQVVVHNPATGVWTGDEAWQLTEELRIGTVADDGPDLFGRIGSLAVDDAGRVYVLESQAQEIRVFDRRGAHVRTIGRKGAGPGEFNRALQIEIGPDGNLWVADPQNNRVSVFDTAGTYLRGHSMAGGFVLIPWPGRFDREGNYYYPVPLPSENDFRVGLVRYDSTLTVLDTFPTLDDPLERERFEHRRGESVAIVGVPFTGGFRQQLSPDGTLWGFLTGPYRMFELSPEGDTIRSITRAFEPLPVTDADMEDAREELAWFIEMGGEVDWSLVPDHKPAIEYAFFDDADHLWVWPVMPHGQDGTALDVFDPVGRFLGRVSPPVPIAQRPLPVVRGDVMYAVTRSELDVPFVIRLGIRRPEPVGDRTAAVP